MKIIHTSDWHLGQVFYNLDRLEEHRAFLCRLRDLVKEEQPDALVVSGDVFDSPQPSIPAQRLYNSMLVEIARACPDMAIVVTAGNHDSASRHELNSELWDEAFSVRTVGRITRDENGEVDWDKFIVRIPGKGYIIAVPHIYADGYPDPGDSGLLPMESFHRTLLGKVAAENSGNLPVVMTAHIAVESCDAHGHESSRTRLVYEPLSLLGEGYDYLALGHIHKPQTLQGTEGKCGTARYSGTPVPVSFDEDYEHSVSVVTIEARGSVPEVRAVVMENAKALYNLPAEAGSFEDAKAAISALPQDAEGYARINIRVKDILPSAQRMELEAMMREHPGVVLCTISTVRSVSAPTELRTYTPDELKQVVDPVQIARDYYAARHDGEQMDDALLKILEEVVAEVEKSDNEA